MSRQAKRLCAKTIERLAHSGRRTQTQGGQPYKEHHAVGGDVPGLHIQITPNGAKQWFLRATVGRKPHPTEQGRWLPVRREFGLGRYPAVTLHAARKRAKAMHAALTLGTDPRQQRCAVPLQAQKTFAECEAATLAAKAPGCKHPAKVVAEWRSRMDRYVNPAFGQQGIGSLRAADVAAVLRPLWRTQYHTAKKIREDLAAVFRYAKAMQLREGENPAGREALEPLLGKPRHRGGHRPSLPFARMAAFMPALRTCPGDAARALEFAILTAARSNEVRGATWQEFNLEKKLWTIPAARTKRGRDHRVPLSAQAVALLQKQAGNRQAFAFVNRNGKPLVAAALGKLLLRMHAENVQSGSIGWLDPDYAKVATPHGFRSSFKDWARHQPNHADEVSELALAHVGNDATRAAYARDSLLDLRVPLMQAWADFCDGAMRHGMADIGADIPHLGGAMA